MDFLHVIIAGMIGTTISVTFFANANKIGLLPSNWDFFMDGQATFLRTTNKFMIYFPRFILGGLAFPALFHYIWGPNGTLGILIFGSIILSGIALALIEVPIMIFGITSNMMKQPSGTTRPMIIMAIIGHINLGFWIGWFPTVI